MLKKIDFKNNKLFFSTIFLLFFVVLLQVSLFSLFSNTWFDEANLGYKAWLSVNDVAQPFESFVTKYPPVSFYFQSFVQYNFGPSIFAGRLSSVLFLILSLFLIFSICKKIGGKWLGLVGVSFLVSHPYLMAYYSSLTPYSMVLFFSLASLWFLFDENNYSGLKRVLLASLSMSLVFLVRYNMLPALILIWVFVFFKWKNWKYLFLSIASSLSFVIISLIPYFILDKGYAISMFSAMFGPLAPLFTSEAFPFYNGSVQFWGSRLEVFISVISRYFHLWLIFIVGFLTLLFNLFKKKYLDFSLFLILNILLVLFILGTHFLFLGRPTYEIYSLYFIPFLILSSVFFLNQFLVYFKLKNDIFLANILLGFIIVIPISVGGLGLTQFLGNPLHPGDSDLARVKKGANFLEILSDIDDIILTTDDPFHIFIAGRYEIPELINKQFTFHEKLDEKILVRFKLYNSRMFIGWMNDMASVIVFQKDDINNRLGVLGNEDFRKEFFKILGEKFEFTGSIKKVYPRRYERGDGEMVVYKRKYE